MFIDNPQSSKSYPGKEEILFISHFLHPTDGMQGGRGFPTSVIQNGTGKASQSQKKGGAMLIPA